MIWFLFYLLGVGISARIFFKWTLDDDKQITVGNSTHLLLSLGSWIMLCIQLLVWIDSNKNKVIYKPKNKDNGLGKN